MDERRPLHDSDHPFAQAGYDFMGACFEVHRILGGGLSEEIYQESLEIELSSRGISFVSKARLLVYYKQQRLKTSYVPDLVVCDNLVIELKSVSQIAPEHEGQLFNYLRVSHHPVGYLVNFGPLKKLEWKRFVISEYL